MSQTAVAPRSKSGGLPEVVVVGVAGLTPLLAYLHNLGFAFVVAVAGLMSLPLLARARKPLPGFAVLLVLALWAVASMRWSLYTQSFDPEHLSAESLTGPKLLLQLPLYGSFVVGALALDGRQAGRASFVLALGVLALAAVFILEGVGKASIYHWIRAVVGQPTGPDFAVRDVGRVAYVLVLLFWPVAIRLTAIRAGKASLGPSALFIAVATVAGAGLLGADAPVAALAISALVFTLTMLGGRIAVLCLLAATVCYFAAAPLLIQAALPALHDLLADGSHESWAVRLDIWRFAVDRILEQPFFGWGLDASRSFPDNIELHPHNGALQLWLELGAVGVALGATFWAWLFLKIARTAERDRTMVAAAAATASVYLTIGGLSFGLWQEWWLALGALAAVACIVGLRARSDPQRSEPVVDKPRVEP